MIKVRFCPKCEGTNIVAVAGMQIGLFECVDCKFRSVIFPEVEKLGGENNEVKKEKNQR